MQLLKNIKHWLAITVFLKEINYVAVKKAEDYARNEINIFKKYHLRYFTNNHVLPNSHRVSKLGYELPYKVKEELLLGVLADMEKVGAIVFEEHHRPELDGIEYRVKAYTYSPKGAANL